MRASMGGGWIRRGALALCLTFAGALAGTAQQKPAPVPLPIATLDQERFFNETKFGRTVLDKFQADTDALIAENRKIEADLEAEERDLTTRRDTVDAATFQGLSEAFDRKVEEIRSARDSTSQALTKRLEDERARFFEAARPVLIQLMADRGVLAVIDKRAVLLGFDAIDLTDTAIARLDATLGDGTNLPALAPTTP